MELKYNEKITASVEIDDNIIISPDDCTVYEKIENDQAFIYIKNSSDKKIKIKFSKKNSSVV